MKYILVIFILSLASLDTYGQDCGYYQLTDGGEPIYAYGMDTTYHWWAVTKPFSNKYRLTVDGFSTDVYDGFTYPVFSPNGNNWGAFADYNGRFDLLLNDSLIYVNAENPGEIVFASLNDNYLFSYMQGSIEVININDRLIDAYDRKGEIFISQFGRKYAYMAQRGGGLVLNINGNETTLYDEIKPFGFWTDGRFMYAAKSGWGWEIYLDNERITQTFDMIYEYKINKFGTNAAFLAGTRNTGMFAVMISDEYYEPLIGKTYDMCTGLVLHPEYPLMAYKAKFNTNYLVVFNNTEYPGKDQVGNPKFTHNGDELFFIHCNIDCDMNINGKNVSLKLNLSPDGDYAVRPNSNSIAYCSSTSLIVKNYQYDDFAISYMLDEISYPRYNRFDKQYEAIGRIFNKLYLVTCSE